MGLAGTRLGFRAGLTYIPAMLRMPPAAPEGSTPTSTQEEKSRLAVGRPADDFLSVARRLECDEDKGRFEATIGKIAKAKPK
jgi:hypothetical protein